MGLTTFLNDLMEIVTALTTMFTSIMAVFMEPPLNLFIGVALFVFITGILIKYIQGKKKMLFISGAMTTALRADTRQRISNIMESEFKKVKK